MNDCLSNVKLLVAGEYGLVIEFGTVISPEINQLVRQLTILITSNPIKGIVEVVPTYRSVTVYFDPLSVTRQELSRFILQLLSTVKLQELDRVSSKMVHIPVCYGGVLGPDLEFVARYTGLSAREVITIHTSKPYLVYMLGFTPGFPYLGGLSEQLMVPRQEKPRAKVPAGSVGIGGNQTGFYPIESPGEWWLIGRTPIRAFNPEGNPPFLVAAGDYLHFVDITIDEYFTIRRDVETGAYKPEISYVYEGGRP
ncbi:5-oxoprolinase subunit B [Sporomusa carbonis]|uniref:5-oxoprolinase subunit PxpB n=1 Tax=Sporomusa carbonis TaxID=3076075 RepID=UPI003A709B50